jgi:mannitol/fructose-specific phosphotransferase system IIA component (Ntr-type)
MQRADRGMHGSGVPETALWLSLIVGYAWTVRSLARLGWEHDPESAAIAIEGPGERMLRTIGSTNPVEVVCAAPAKEVQARIADLLTADLVVLSLDAGGRDDVIEALAMRVAARHPAVDAGRLVEALREREEQMTTAFGGGVAIPHARLDGLECTVAAFARSSSGIQWESPDGQPTRLIFLLAGPSDRPGAHLKALAGASRLLSDARCRARLLEAAGEAELLAVLREEEDLGLKRARAA